ncbi:MAG: hypothetical protein A2X49_01110 [Lentisphaerae bacterium GWF2_52_8]|nr:MAG: hypothetical protein A2X49_01110 [Lentisphaerae bacterium GWF2_52_8]
MAEGTKRRLELTAMGKSIDIRWINTQTPLGLHEHAFQELVIITRGQGIHFTETEEYPISAGDVFFIKPEFAHGYRDTSELQLVNVLYYLERLKIPESDLREMPGYRALFELEPKMRQHDGFEGRLRLSLDELAHAIGIVRQIEEELEHREPGHQFLSLSFLMGLIGYLSRCYYRSQSEQARSLLRLSSLITFLEKNYQKDISLDALAKQAHMSKSTLIRSFRKSTGYTPIEHLINIRVAKASSLLRENRASVAEAALASGFSDTNYFSRQFKKVTGLSPRSYRQLSSLLKA